MKIIAREEQIKELDRITQNSFPQFVVVYGRRRVGKTYLIREYFHNSFSFYATGVLSPSMKDQLRFFHSALVEKGYQGACPKNWATAFSALKEVLEAPNVYRDASGKRVVFLDEVSWMATKKSDFKIALDVFWNTYASAREDMILIICGSAASYIIDNFVKDNGGFHHRITSRLYLPPFSLKETEDYLTDKGIVISRRQICECYMVFGGVPFYLNLLDSRLSLAQNIDRLCFREDGELHNEFKDVMKSLFGNHQRHIEVLEALCKKKNGLTRRELVKEISFEDGGMLSEILKELEQCRFIQRVDVPSSKAKDAFFQVIDPFSLFAKRFLDGGEVSSWLNYVGTPGFYAWAGNIFEIVCMNHIPQIKHALGIDAVETKIFAWQSKQKKGGSQIDLVLLRKDGIINLCEMKFTAEPFQVTLSTIEELDKKSSAFLRETHLDLPVRSTLISYQGIARGGYGVQIPVLITGDDLFKI